MAKRSLASIWTRAIQRTLKSATRSGLRAGTRVVRRSLKTALPAVKRVRSASLRGVLSPAVARRVVAPDAGEWISGMAMASAGARRYQLFRPPGVALTERLPLLVMLHGCTQDAQEFARSTRMNRLATRERFFVLYPEQDRRANPQGCWNWYGTATGQAQGEAAILAAAVEQVCTLYPVDRSRVAVLGLSAGASMAALMVAREPQRFKAVVMHSGIPPGMANSAVSALGAMRGRGGGAVLPHPAAPGSQAARGLPPLLVIHGDADGTVAPSNGRAAAQVWAEALGATALRPREQQRGQRYPATVTDFERAGRVLVTLCEVEGLGHAWSGGDARQPFGDAAGPDASSRAWAFIDKQFRAAAATA